MNDHADKSFLRPSIPAGEILAAVLFALVLFGLPFLPFVRGWIHV